MASEPDANPNPNPQSASIAPHPNPPSIEAAYKRKCIALKKRLTEVEAHNEAMRLRNAQGIRYVQKMRLESCILLERLSVLMNMADGSGRKESQLASHTTALMNESGALVDEENSKESQKRSEKDMDVLGDESDGSSGNRPPTPQERPLRVKRNRKSDERPATLGAADNNVAHTVSNTFPISLPSLIPYCTPCAATGCYYQPGPFPTPPPPPFPPPSSHLSFNPNYHHTHPSTLNNPHPAILHPQPIGPTIAQPVIYYTTIPATTNPAFYASPCPPAFNHAPPADTRTTQADNHHTSSATQQQANNESSSLPPPAPGREPPHRYVSAFEAFSNQNRSNIAAALVRVYGQRVMDEDIDRAMVKEWDSLEPAKKREFGDRLERDGGV